jgi:uncharacterized LabA/DUF88 family protein
LESSKQIACFLDVENIRYSLVNQGRELSPELVAEKALKYGLLSVARAYADFSRHPEMIRRGLVAAGFDIVDVRVKQLPNGGTKSSADFYMLMDIIDTVLDRPQIETFVLMTGDGDFVQVSARLKTRFGKTVVVAGVPGSISADLVASATVNDPFEVAESDIRPGLIRAIDSLKPPRSGILTFKYIDTGVRFVATQLGIQAERVPYLLGELKEDGILIARTTIAPDGREVTVTELNRQHPLVEEALKRQQIG